MTNFEIANTIIDKLLSWQFLCFVILFAFYKPLCNLLNRLKSAKAGDKKLKFSAKNKEPALNEMNDLIAIIQETKPAELDSFQQQVELIADISPAAAIPFAYAQLVNKCSRELPDVYGWKADQNQINVVMKGLHDHKDIDDNTYNRFNAMKTIYNGILFNKDTWNKIKKEDAIAYADNVETLMDTISIFQDEP